ncbi:MAG: hypothetical protein JO286_20590 [Solirubrobacterales bacterium]|nr:hypothetical protein [Solirubrobacterales bacterium]MBV9809594.1 hypothetical protein [Solirubrobacterales bacterium]
MSIHTITRPPRFAQLRRAGLGGVLAVLAVLALAPTAGAATVVGRPPGSPGPSWSITPTPNPPGATGDLRAVSCTAANACTAVGTSASFPHPVQALAERWNGASWTIQPTNPAFSSSNTLFNGVSCTSASSCLAVGEVSGFAVSELWNGKTWNLLPALLKPGPAVFSTLNSVSCTSASNCMAVGSWSDSSNIQHTLAYLWNGSFWALQATQDPFGAIFDTLNSVSCPSATSCLAVGGNGKSPLYESWNGSRWSAGFGIANNSTGASFAGTSCTSATACSVVGENFNLAGEFTLANLINPTGLGVSFFTTPSPGKNSSLLGAVSCPAGPVAARDLLRCIAVGKDNDFAGTFVTLAEFYDGASPPGGWSTMTIPTPTSSSGTPIAASLNGISCPAATDCIAVGSDTAGTLAEQLTTVSGPHALSITRQGKVIALLRKPRTLELLVSKLGPRGGRLLGAVALGSHPKGRSQIDWNLHVAGRRLAAGTYMAELVTVLAGGATSDGPAVTFKLDYPSGPIRVLSSTCSVAAATSGRC